MIDISSDDLSERLLSGQELDGRDFSGKTCVGTHFEGAHLTAAKFYGADLRRAFFGPLPGQPTRLVQADLREADVRDADFTWANLIGADLRGVQYDETTTWTGVRLEKAQVDAGSYLEELKVTEAERLAAQVPQMRYETQPFRLTLEELAHVSTSTSQGSITVAFTGWVYNDRERNRGHIEDN